MNWFYLLPILVLAQNNTRCDVDETCPDDECCSVWGYCGKTKKHCGKTHRKGRCGVIRNVKYVCRDKECCSEFGYCGNEFCSNSTERVLLN